MTFQILVFSNASKSNCFEANCISFNNFKLLFSFIVSRGHKIMFGVAPRAFTKALQKSAHKWLLSISKYMIIQCLQSPTEPCLYLAFNFKKNPCCFSANNTNIIIFLWCTFWAKKDQQRDKVLHASYSEANATRCSTWYSIPRSSMDYIYF